jgi:hypothetical protein
LSTTAGSNRTVYGIDAEEAKVLQSLYRDARRGKIERAASPMGFQFGLVKEMLPEDEPRLSVVTLEDRTVLAVNGGRLVPTTLDPGETLVWAVNATQMTSPETLINGALVATSERLLLVPSVGEEGRWAVEWSKVKSITPQKLPDDLRRAAKRSGLSLAAGIIGDQLFEFPGTGLAARYVMKKLKRWHVCVELATGERQYLLSSGVGAKDASAALDRIRANSRLRKQRFVHEESIVTLAELVGETAVTDDQAADSTAPMADEAEVSVPPAPGSNAADRTEPKTALVSADTAGASSPRTGSSPENANGDVPLRQIDRLASKTVDRLAPDEQQAIRNLERLAERGLLPTVQYETSVLRTLATAGISDREWFDWSLRAERQNEAGVVDGFLVTRSAGVQFVPVEPTAPTWAAAWDAVADVDLAFLDTVDGTAATDDVLLTVTAAGGRVESFVVGSDAGSSVDATVEALSSFVDRSTPAIGEDDVTPSVADGSASARGRRTSG